MADMILFGANSVSKFVVGVIGAPAFTTEEGSVFNIANRSATIIVEARVASTVLVETSLYSLAGNDAVTMSNIPSDVKMFASSGDGLGPA